MQKFWMTLLALPLAALAQPSTEPTGELKQYESALERQRATFGENSAAYAAALVDLARAYQAGAKRSGDAVSLYRQALPIQEATLGREHPDVANTLYYLALDEHGRKRLDQAQELYQRALDIRTRAFGVSDPRLAEILTPLAALKDDEMLYQRSLAILDASEKKSPLTATTLEKYAAYLRAHDRVAEAETLEARAKDLRVGQVAQIGARRGAANGPQPYRVNAAEGVKAPSLKYKVEPEYSDLARLDKVEGPVVLKIVVGADGLAHDIQLVRGVGWGLDEKAAEAIGKWIFNPGTRNGQAVPVMATVEVNFRLL